jgi:hypothetical protein
LAALEDLIKGKQGKSAAERLRDLSGKTREQARQEFIKEGFEYKGRTPGGYEKWYHPDDSRVQIRPNGEIVRTGPRRQSEGGGPAYRPRIGPDGKSTPSHNTGERVE